MDGGEWDNEQTPIDPIIWSKDQHDGLLEVSAEISSS